MLTVAGSRAGKSVSLMIPNLLLHDGSVLAIDPKGELTRVTARARKEKGQPCYVLDPFGENGRYPSNSYDPLAELDPDSETLADDAGLIADALIIGNQKDPHWTDNARRILKAIILFVVHVHDPDLVGLGAVRDLLMLRDRAINLEAERLDVLPEEGLLLYLKTAGDAVGGVIASEAEAFLSLYKKSDREFASIMSTARTQTEFLDSAPLRKIIGRSDFSMRDLRRRPATVYLCLPAMRMASHANWLRIIITMGLIAFEREHSAGGEVPVLVLLEEFHVLGHMRALEAAAALIAGYGVKLWTVLQDLGQIKNGTSLRARSCARNCTPTRACVRTNNRRSCHRIDMAGGRLVKRRRRLAVVGFDGPLRVRTYRL